MGRERLVRLECELAPRPLRSTMHPARARAAHERRREIIAMLRTKPNTNGSAPRSSERARQPHGENGPLGNVRVARGSVGLNKRD